MKIRLPAMTSQVTTLKSLRKGLGVAITAAGAGVALHAALLHFTALPLLLAVLAAILLLALAASALAWTLLPQPQLQPVRVALPAPRPWR